MSLVADYPDVALSPLRPPSAPSHIPALDGVRGAAILLVMWHHFSLVDPAFHRFGQFAWLGVDLFFVLSGFLITGILYDAKGSTNYFRSFYMRRALRILPLYYAFIAMRLLVLPSISRLGNSYPPVEDGPWFWLFLSNFKIAAVGEFKYNMLNVTWSLAVEEHFYLVWPIVVFLLGRRALLRVCVGVAAAALALRIILSFHANSELPMYVLSFCRMDALAIGGLIALAVRGPLGLWPLRRLAWFALPISAIAILAMMLITRQSTWATIPMETGGFTLLAILFGSLLVLTLRPAGPVHALFATGPLRILGQYSYALYLLHSPIRDIVQFHLFRPTSALGCIGFTLLCLALSLAAALASWHLYEKHFLKLKALFPAGVRSRPWARADRLPRIDLAAQAG